MARRIAVFLLALAAGYALANGMARWRARQEPCRAAAAFFDRLLSDRNDLPESLTYRIGAVQRSPEAATVRVTLACDRCRLHSTLRLARTSAGTWLIDAAPLQADLLRMQRHTQGQHLARCLAQALADRANPPLAARPAGTRQ